MHYEIDFEGKDEWDAYESGEEAANRTFGHVHEAIAAGICRIAFALSGVEGYPVERYHPECRRH